MGVNIALGMVLVGVAGGLVSCSEPSGSSSFLAQAEPTPQPTIQLGGETPSSAKNLTLKLTLSSPDDLRVREGDWVMAGQVLSDRVRDRQRLTTQQEELRLQIAKVKQPIPNPVPLRPVPAVASLPAPNFLEPVADVERMKLKAAAAQRRKEAQQRKLDLLQTLPSNELPEAVIPHEQAVLADYERQVDQANADVLLAQATLAQAQNERQYQEYQHSLEISKRAIALQQAELQHQQQRQEQEKQSRDQEFQLAQLNTQRQALEAQLQAIASTRSPYSGKIRRIKWTGQSDQALTVELTLALAGSPGNRPAITPNPQPSPAPSPDQSQL